MATVRRKACDFKSEIERESRSAMLYGTEELLKVAVRPDFAADHKRAAKAELLLRFYLSPRRGDDVDSPIAAVLAEWMGTECLSDFLTKCEVAENSQSFDDVLDHMNSSCSASFGVKDVDAVSMSFRPYIEADGVIPVFSPEGGHLIPFRFVERTSSPCVMDGSDVGVCIDEWSQYLAAMPDIDMDVRVECPQLDGMRFEGDSLMLPLRMAWWRKRSDLPRYRPLRFISTGAFRGGRLAPVATDEKESKIKMDVKGGLLVKPGNGKREIDVGLEKDDVLDKLKVLAEETTACESIYALKRLEDFEALVHRENSADWATVILRLDNASAKLNRHVYPDAFLSMLMLRSTARCHAGRTEDAARLNREARAFAAGKPEYEARLLRAEIEGLVIMQDMEDFPRLFDFARDLGTRIGSYAAEKGETDLALDLRMRYSGTMGQVYAYAALAGVAEGSADKSQALFNVAYDAASRLKERAEQLVARGGEKQELLNSINEMAHDANYFLLWKALFSPCDMDEAFEQAEGISGVLREFKDLGGERCANKNDGFRRRTHAFGLYRLLLSGGNVGAVPDYDELITKGYFWIAATTGKYMAAIAASRKQFGRAHEWFAAADKKMTEDRKDNDGVVVRVIHMTVLAEAFHSLRNTLYAEFAEDARRRALALLGAPENADWHKEAWKEYLEHPDDKPYPALTYWY